MANIATNAPNFSEEHRQHLADKGWVVVPDVISDSDLCSTLAKEMQDYMYNLRADKKWPVQNKSLVQTYRAAHIRSAWLSRLHAKPVFEKIWDTEKLLTSFDGVAISRPAEQGEESFDSGERWLHVDQGADRKGLHCYQGAVYLEDCSEDDYCLRVLQGSHKLHEEFFRLQPVSAKVSSVCNYHAFSKHEIDWYIYKGCEVKRVAVPKGHMVLWDSRTMHDNAKPIEGREHARWRSVCFVSMAPAAWARQQDIDKKKRAYDGLKLTAHWPSRGVNTMPDSTGVTEGVGDSPGMLQDLPDEAKTKDARLLAGVEAYDFNDHMPNGPAAPVFLSELYWYQKNCTLL